jgi:hypothetical protein
MSENLLPRMWAGKQSTRRVQADSYMQGWNAAIQAAAQVCAGADKSTHPADLADRIRELDRAV